MRSRLARRAAVLLGVVLVGALAAAGGAGCRKAQPLVLTVPWSAGEVLRLEVRSSETEAFIADWVMTVEADAATGEWVLATDLETADAEERSTVWVGQTDLIPSRVEYERRDSQGTAVYAGVYGGGKAVLTATIYGEEQSAEVKLPDPPYFDNEQLVMTMRAMPLGEGWSAKVSDIVTRTASKAAVTLAVVGREEVAVPAGVFDCWVVQIRGAQQKAWVAVSPPHHLVQYVNEGAKTISRLVEYQAGR